MIRVVIAEDQAMVRGALIALLSIEEDLEIIGEAANGLEAIEAVERLLPDVCILDIEMPIMNGLEASERLVEKYPGVAIIMLTTFGRTGYLQRSVNAGVKGFLLKDGPSSALAEAIRIVAAGQRVVDPELAFSLFTEKDQLSEREQELLMLASKGLANKEISKQLFLSEGTVRNYFSDIFQKLQVKSRTEAIHVARKNGLIDME
ncbi:MULTISPECIES: response regulator transcription factor [Sporosarcina]|uniref:Two-component system response regulator DesR n=1 Tax=Sporosarcina psychrophila TaxID=1476 RepID=A0ABV2K863_SPOPS|nr:response regulator transcription factor [Sporosarcina psychrophila]AMQ04860.1 DNA-binding response regulator [Sporosarcina psychrophila]